MKPAARSWRSLTERDHAILDVFLQAEADMAYRRRLRILLDFLELRDGDGVLDGGCGTGAHLVAMSRLRQLRLVGLDRDLERLRRAHQQGVPGLLVRADLADMPFAAGSFDKVLMTEVLEHLGDDRPALREVLRVLRPGGVLALSVPHARFPLAWDPISKVWGALGGAPLRNGPLVGIWTNHERLYLPNELKAHLEEAGFVVEAVEEATHHSLAFMHLLLYGLGKPLVERRLLPRGMRRAVDRLGSHGAQPAGLNPIALGVKILRTIDRRNDASAVAAKKTFVNVLVKARRHGQS